ncbi:hypothetical protein A3844_26910 [Paenibacillus helianthi]|uniref:NAD-dependent epimerase/dehydratase domain-containing protein n=1 Tax=Paenibacillus helianthi TaxID=1349432 RepID=A0ABX3EI86_9BACL|nr:ADP-glyceromanno-heptose 6-epimerase [Paenibacillus helianthi]OKP80716.1 hypothetical protein A3844_26910 [Paenibacillus helianthi]
MIIVTGGAGFIGSNLVRRLNQLGEDNVIIADRVSPHTLGNLKGLRYNMILSPDELQERMSDPFFASEVDFIFHEGACSDTMETDSDYLYANNFLYSKKLLDLSLKNRIPFVYASSASIYGQGTGGFVEDCSKCKKPMNLYAHSKYLFDQYVTSILPDAESQIVGLRYFNVYGSGEAHKGRMASMIYKMYFQLKEHGEIKLFRGTEADRDGEQRRDFIHVNDVIDINLFFLQRPAISGIFNCGTGISCSFNDIAWTMIGTLGYGRLTYIDFPEELIGKYQMFTESNNNKLRNAGYLSEYTSIQEGLKQYLNYLCENNPIMKEKLL